VAVAGEAFPVSVKEAEASIMAGSSADGAASVVASAGCGTVAGKVEASEIQAPSMPAESNSTTRLTVWLPENVILFMSSCEALEIEVCGIAIGKARIQGVLHGAWIVLSVGSRQPVPRGRKSLH
jgi:hypothetical protein